MVADQKNPWQGVAFFRSVLKPIFEFRSLGIFGFLQPSSGTSALCISSSGDFMTEFKSDPQRPETGRTTQPSGGDSYTFRCSDVGFKACNWETRGSSPEEVLRNAEQHGREQHHLTSIDDATRDKVRSNIRRAA